MGIGIAGWKETPLLGEELCLLVIPTRRLSALSGSNGFGTCAITGLSWAGSVDQHPGDLAPQAGSLTLAA